MKSSAPNACSFVGNKSRNGKNNLMKTIYLDTDALICIINKRNFSENQSKILWSAINSKKISIVLSATNIEELIAPYKSMPDQVFKDLQSLTGLADWAKIIKHPCILIPDLIKNYAESSSSEVSPYIYDYNVILNLKRINFGDKYYLKELYSDTYKETRKQIRKFERYLFDTQQKIYAKIKNPHKVPHDFNSFYNTHAENYMKEIIKPLGNYYIEKCDKRGIQAMFDIRGLSITAGLGLSLIYSQIFEKQKPKKGDSRDQHNAISASMTDIFVTNEKSTLPKLINRIPKNKLTLLNLAEFINYIAQN